MAPLVLGQRRRQQLRQRARHAAHAQAPAQAGAQRYPDKPMRIMVGASPGGGTDILARMLADKFGAA
jgi:tripartite-type tricarboxylate transporter receptor subunit TctC